MLDLGRRDVMVAYDCKQWLEPTQREIDRKSRPKRIANRYIAACMIVEAAKNPAFAKELLDRTEGKVPDRVDVSQRRDVNITITLAGQAPQDRLPEPISSHYSLCAEHNSSYQTSDSHLISGEIAHLDGEPAHLGPTPRTTNLVPSAGVVSESGSQVLAHERVLTREPLLTHQPRSLVDILRAQGYTGTVDELVAVLTREMGAQRRPRPGNAADKGDVADDPQTPEVEPEPDEPDPDAEEVDPAGDDGD